MRPVLVSSDLDPKLPGLVSLFASLFTHSLCRSLFQIEGMFVFAHLCLTLSTLVGVCSAPELSLVRPPRVPGTIGDVVGDQGSSCRTADGKGGEDRLLLSSSSPPFCCFVKEEKTK